MKTPDIPLELGPEVAPPILGLPIPIDGRAEDDRDEVALGVIGARILVGGGPPFGVRLRAIGVRGVIEELGGARPPEGNVECVGVSGSEPASASSRSLRILLGGRRFKASWR